MKHVPKGSYVSGPADRFLLVPKNRYRVVLLPDQPRSNALGVGWVTEDNSPEGYDLLWGDAKHVDAFRLESGHVRDKLTLPVGGACTLRVRDGRATLHLERYAAMPRRAKTRAKARA